MGQTGAFDQWLVRSELEPICLGDRLLCAARSSPQLSHMVGARGLRGLSRSSPSLPLMRRTQ